MYYAVEDWSPMCRGVGNERQECVFGIQKRWLDGSLLTDVRQWKSHLLEGGCLTMGVPPRGRYKTILNYLSKN